MKKFFIILTISGLFFSCHKEKNNDPIVPPPEDSTTFEVPASKDIVMYEVNLRALSQSGDIQGVINRLDAIKALGINVIWLMPIYPVGQVNSINSPYCVRDYKQVNPEFGSLSDLKALVNEAHTKGMAVILDWVANHTAWDNPWIVNTDWYTQDGSGNIISPPGTNWADVADLNYNSQAMRLAMIDAMEYWVSKANIDGFRCDAADMVPVDFWIQAINSVNGSTAKDLIWLAEGSSNNLFSAGFEINYAWNYYSKLKEVYQNNLSAATLITTHNQEYSGLAPGKEKLRFTTNHDESAHDATPMVIFGGEQGAMAASVATFCLGGVPLIYSSQEVGTVENVPFFSNQPINWSQHPEMLQAYKDLLGFYGQTEAMKSGDMTSYSTADVLAFTRIAAQDTVFVIDNLRNMIVSYAVPAGKSGTTWEDVMEGREFLLNETVELAAYQYLILKKQPRRK